jgi:hypothetical protein
MAKTKKTKAVTKDAALSDWAAHMAKINEERAKKRATLFRELKKISAELYAKGITIFSCEYNGEGDSGDISYAYYEKNPAFGDKKSSDISEETMDKLRNIVWEMVPDGFENNDGGFGTVKIDFASKTISTEHSDRIIEVETTERTFDFDGEKL